MGVIAAVGSGVASATAATETGDEQPLESRSAPRTGAATSSEVVVRSKLRLLEAMLAPGGPASRLDAAHEEAVRRGAAVARQRHAAAVEALAAGRLSDADTELSMALRELGNALRQSGDPEQARRQARRRYAELVDRVKGFRDAYDRIVADKARTQEGLLDVAELDGAVALAAGLAGDREDEPGQRQRRQDMRALVAAGARQEIGDTDRDHEPGEDRDLQRARNPARGEIDRKGGERDQRAEQPGRDEGAVARGRQRVLLNRRMNQAVDIIAERLNETQGNPTRQRNVASALPIRSGIVSDRP